MRVDKKMKKIATKLYVHKCPQGTSVHDDDEKMKKRRIKVYVIKCSQVSTSFHDDG